MSRGPTSKDRAAYKTLTQLQQKAVDDILAIPTLTSRGSGHLQGRMRRRIMSHYYEAARGLGYTMAQVDAQFVQIREMVELEQGAK